MENPHAECNEAPTCGVVEEVLYKSKQINMIKKMLDEYVIFFIIFSILILMVYSPTPTPPPPPQYKFIV